MLVKQILLVESITSILLTKYKPVTLHIQHFSSSTEALWFGINSDLKHPYKNDLVDIIIIMDISMIVQN